MSQSVTSSPRSQHNWPKTWVQQRHMSNHRVWCFCALPGSSSTTLISRIYRTHCIQSTYLLRTRARQNPSLLTAVVSKNRAYSRVWGWRGVWNGRTGRGKKKLHINMRDSSTEKSLWALLLLHMKSKRLKKCDLFIFPFFHSIYPLEWHTWRTSHKRVQTDYSITRSETTSHMLRICLYDMYVNVLV